VAVTEPGAGEMEPKQQSHLTMAGGVNPFLVIVIVIRWFDFDFSSTRWVGPSEKGINI
jgi:hypothetical protein